MFLWLKEIKWNYFLLVQFKRRLGKLTNWWFMLPSLSDKMISKYVYKLPFKYVLKWLLSFKDYDIWFAKRVMKIWQDSKTKGTLLSWPRFGKVVSKRWSAIQTEITKLGIVGWASYFHDRVFWYIINRDKRVFERLKEFNTRKFLRFYIFLCQALWMTYVKD